MNSDCKQLDFMNNIDFTFVPSYVYPYPLNVNISIYIEYSLYLNWLHIVSETEDQTQTEPEANFYHHDFVNSVKFPLPLLPSTIIYVLM